MAEKAQKKGSALICGSGRTCPRVCCLICYGARDVGRGFRDVFVRSLGSPSCPCGHPCGGARAWCVRPQGRARRATVINASRAAAASDAAVARRIASYLRWAGLWKWRAPAVAAAAGGTGASAEKILLPRLADQLNNLSTYIFRQGLPQTMRPLWWQCCRSVLAGQRPVTPAERI
jgi:hypothetical protein